MRSLGTDVDIQNITYRKVYTHKSNQEVMVCFTAASP